MGVLFHIFSKQNTEVQPINSSFRWLFTPELKFSSFYGSFLGITCPLLCYLKHGKAKNAFMQGLGMASLTWYFTHQDLNWHRVRYGNYRTLTAEAQKLAKRQSKENREASFKKQTGKDFSEISGKLIEDSGSK